jgi:uncharacterized protein YegP (UPF0339 family)
MKNAFRGVALALALAIVLGPVGMDFAAAQAKKGKDKDKDVKGAVAATFELYKDSAGEFRFRLKDDDGALLATSGKGYKTKADCQKVIDAIKRDAAKAKVEDESK